VKQFTICLVMLGLAGLVLGLAELYRVDRAAFWIGIAALVLLAVYLGVTSIYVIGPNDMIASYFQGTQRITYVNGKYGRKLEADQRARRLRDEQVTGTRYGHAADLVFLPWCGSLLWQGLRFPTTAIKLPVRAGRVLTKRGDNRSPRVRLRVDTTMILRLSPNVSSIVEGFEILQREKGWDLTRKEPMQDKDEKIIQAPCIAKVLLDTAQETILEAVRVASSRYSWEGEHWDVVGNKPALERDVLRVLSEPESLFVQAGILEVIPKGWEELPTGAPLPEPKAGPAALSVDFNIEEITPDPIPEGASELEKAIDLPLIAVLEAKATVLKAEAEKERERLIREGRAAGMAAIANGLGAEEDRMEVMRMETIERSQAQNIFGSIGGGAFGQIVQRFFRGRRGRGAQGAPRQPPQPGGPPAGGPPPGGPQAGGT